MDDSPDISIATSDRTPRQLELLSIERLDVMYDAPVQSARGIFPDDLAFHAIAMAKTIDNEIIN